MSETSSLAPQKESGFAYGRNSVSVEQIQDRIREKTKTAFTLAEVLITLGIIGVVAALTLPTLITNYQKKETVSKLKKVYSELQQATLMARQDYGEVDSWDFSDPYSFGQKYYVPYLQVIKKTEKDRSYSYIDLAGEVHYPNTASFILADGTYVYFALFNRYEVPFHILVDLNGMRGPNILGRDLFAFSYCNGKLSPYSQYKLENFNRTSVMLAGYSGQCNKKARGGTWGVGSNCSRLIMIDGWKISKDYPW